MIVRRNDDDGGELYFKWGLQACSKDGAPLGERCVLTPETLARALAAVMVTDSPDNREALRRALIR